MYITETTEERIEIWKSNLLLDIQRQIWGLRPRRELEKVSECNCDIDDDSQTLRYGRRNRKCSYLRNYADSVENPTTNLSFLTTENEQLSKGVCK